jgi:tetratricopeptide (TPR) repeat protein
MYNIWPLVVIMISLLIIIFIIFKKFPALAVLDVENIPEEKEQQIKERIIKSRIQRKFSRLNVFFTTINSFFVSLYEKLWNKIDSFKKKQEKIINKESMAEVGKDDQVKILFSQAEALIKEEKISDAEQKLIEIIGIDDKNLMAFHELGELYHEGGKLQEAKQTLLYALKLAEIENVKTEQANINYSLALVAKEFNDIDGAILHVLKALDKDANSPRYLDLMLDLCIIKKDRSLAEDYLRKIKEVNPDNKNIIEWEKEIDNLPK